MTKLEEYITQIQKAQQNNPSGWTAANSMSMTQLRAYLSDLNRQGTHASHITVIVGDKWMSLEDAVRVDPSFKTIKRLTPAQLKQLTKEKKSQESFLPVQKASLDAPSKSVDVEQNLPSDILSQPVVVEQNLASEILSQSVVVEQNLPSDILSQPVVVEQNLASEAVSQPVVVDSRSVETVSQSQNQKHLDILDSPVWETLGKKAEPTESKTYFDLQFFQDAFDTQGSDGDVGDESDSEKKSVWMNYKNFEDALLGKDSWFTYEDLVTALKNENGQYVINWADGNMDEYRAIAEFFGKEEIVNLLITKYGASKAPSQEQQSSKEEIKVPNTNLTFFEGQPLKSNKPEPSVAVKEKIVITYIQFLKYLESPKGVKELTSILLERNKNEIEFEVHRLLPPDSILLLVNQASLKGEKGIEYLLVGKFLDEMNPEARNNNQTPAALSARSRMTKINDYLDNQYKQYRDNKKDEIMGHAHFITHLNTLLHAIYASFIWPNRHLYEGGSYEYTMGPYGSLILTDRLAKIEMHLHHSDSISKHTYFSKNDVCILGYASESNIPTLLEKAFLLKDKKIPFIIVVDDSLQEKDINQIEQLGAILCIECSNPREPEGLKRLFQQAAIISDMNEKERDHYRQAYWAERQYQLYLSSNVDGVASDASWKLLNELYDYYDRYSSTSLEQARNSLVSSSVFQFLAPSAVTKTVEAKTEDNKKGGALKLIQKLLLDMRNIAGDNKVAPLSEKEPEFTLAEVKALLEGQLSEKIGAENSAVRNMLLAKQSKLEYEANQQQTPDLQRSSSLSRSSRKGVN